MAGYDNIKFLDGIKDLLFSLSLLRNAFLYKQTWSVYEYSIVFAVKSMTHNNSADDTIPARSIGTSISGQFTRHAACQSRIIDSRGICVERKY